MITMITIFQVSESWWEDGYFFLSALISPLSAGCPSCTCTRLCLRHASLFVQTQIQNHFRKFIISKSWADKIAADGYSGRFTCGPWRFKGKGVVSKARKHERMLLISSISFRFGNIEKIFPILAVIRGIIDARTEATSLQGSVY